MTPTIDSALQRMFRAMTSHPVTVLVFFLALTAWLGWQARRFQVDATADTLLTRGNRDYIRTQVVNRRFSPQEFLLIAYQPTAHPLLSQQTFNDLRALTGQLRRLDRVESVRSLLNAPLFTLADAGLSSDTDASHWTIEERDFAMEEIQTALRDHPIYENLLVNEKQTATAIQVLFKADAELERINDRIVDLQQQSLSNPLSDDQAAELQRLKQQAAPIKRRLDRQRTAEVTRIRSILEPYEARADLYMGGVHVLGFQLIRIIKNDLIVFGGAIAVMICIILMALFRGLRWVAIPVICCACSVLATMGLFGMLGLKTTVISSNFIALQLILTLAIVVHLIVQYREYNVENPGWAQQRLVQATLQRKAAPCFYAGMTTSVGFASLLFSGIQPVIAFGWMMIIAMFVSIGVSLLLFPALMAMFPRRDDASEIALTRHILDALRRVTVRHPLPVGAIGLAVFAAGVAGCLRLDVENSFLNYFRASTRVHRELSFIDRQFGGSTPLDVVYTMPSGEASNRVVIAAETVQQLQRVQTALNRHAAVGKILSLVNVTELARKVNGDRPLTEYELTALYWMMEDSLREDLLGSFFAPEHHQARFSVRIRDTTEGLDRGALLRAIRSDFAKLGIPPERYTLSNLFVLYQDILQRLLRSQALTLGIVYAVLALTFWIIFRSLKIAVIAMVPNVLSTAAVLGTMGWLRIPLDLMTITIAAIAMGIAVDDTIHYVHRYLEEVGEHDPVRAVERTHGSVGYAVLYTSLIIVLGFSLLSFSDFVPSVLFGLLTGLAMLTALLSDLCVLPALLRRFTD